VKYKVCKICNEEIKNEKDLIKPNSNVGNVHIECFRNKLLEKQEEVIVNEKINHFIEERDIKIDEKLKKEKLKNEIKLKNQKNKIKNIEFKNQFYEYIKLHYDCNLTTYFFTKVSNIVNGTFKGLKEGITYEDLLYMFKTKQKELDKIAYDKNTKGKGFKDSLAKLNFDLVVIVNKYDGFKKWKEKQKLIETKNDDTKRITDGLISMDMMKANQKNNIESDDIGDLLDEVF
jgi:hypothetical protein